MNALDDQIRRMIGGLYADVNPLLNSPGLRAKFAPFMVHGMTMNVMHLAKEIGRMDIYDAAKGVLERNQS